MTHTGRGRPVADGQRDRCEGRPRSPTMPP